MGHTEGYFDGIDGSANNRLIKMVAAILVNASWNEYLQPSLEEPAAATAAYRVHSVVAADFHWPFSRSAPGPCQHGAP